MTTTAHTTAPIVGCPDRRPNRNAAPSALDAYNGARGRVANLLTELANKVAENDHDKFEGIHWGHVGDLSYVESQLADVVAFLAGEG